MNTNGIWTERSIALEIKSTARNAVGSSGAPGSMQAVKLARLSCRLAISTAAVALLLSACTFPGMRMGSAPTIPLSSGGEQAASEWMAAAPSSNAIPVSDFSQANVKTDSQMQAVDIATANAGPLSSTVDASPPAGATQLEVPISDINVALIQTLRREEAQQSARNQPRLFSIAEPYTMGVGDVLLITVWDHPELTAALGANTQTQVRPSDAPAGFVVDQAGNIAFPYAGTLNVMGLRTDQVQAQLFRRLTRVYREPQVTVRIASFRAKKVYIDGEVHAPGVQPINDVPMTLYEAIARAGGFTSAADQGRMVLLRDSVSYPINLQQMIDSHANPSKILLKDGDLLRVVSRDENGVFVMGEINKPMTAVPLRTGKLSLSDALSQAGSVNMMTADATQMYVIRGGDGTQPRVFHLDGHSPVSMILANQFELQPKDVVYVDSTGLARFSRVLSQLLPAINAGLTATVVTR
jgi:polysaccharide export outer membrane protein